MATRKKEDEETDDAVPDKDATQGVTKDENAIDETVPGGRYVVNGKTVNSEGEPIKK